MPSAVSADEITSIQQNLQYSSDKSIRAKTSEKRSNRTTLFKTVAISGVLVLYLVSIFIFNDHPNCQASEFFVPLSFTRTPSKPSPTDDSPTDLSHVVFGLVGSEKAWRNIRKSYVEAWWRPNVTRGYLYLDRAPSKDLLPWSSSSPPLRVSEDNTKRLEESKHVDARVYRMVHAIVEVFREEHEGVRWYVMGDDDSIFFVDNMVRVFSKYDHTKYFYIGGHSENLLSTFIHSFDMAFGGAGFALSYPLAAALARDIENCLKRYWYLHSADQTLMSCVADFGVSLTAHKGLHQVDLHHDISGYLSAHPQAPLLSLHHFDKVEPIFPTMNRVESTNHLMKASDVDQSRLLQQTICYQKQSNWSFSISWGYSAHIYENVFPRSILKKPLETFWPWSKNPRPPHFRFNTRWPSNDSCEAPHVFFFESIEKSSTGDEIVTNYVRSSSRGLPACLVSGNHSADYISKIQVFSPVMNPPEDGRSECCDVLPLGGTNITRVNLRACMEDEIIA